jgi:hypothetical protein
MKNRSKTGNAFQDWIQKWILENYRGSAVHNQKSVAKVIKLRDPKTGQLVDRWVSQRNDILGCIDLIWVDAMGFVTFIQATADTGISRKVKELAQVHWNFGRGYNVELWVKRAAGKADIMRLAGRSDFPSLIKIGSIIRRKLIVDF